ncbi:hypothetical protein [Paenibacillus sp. LHD-38]|uniref:hypothetical protein n=1 Tax=Paenibacillus sp. LHD-38 TaxID=3072143 RepID=UPI00280E1AFB|nr:hypothetical protein [Paenibacillus sp. LHD-38]MDQ8736182.1 hypothetical protein [Paenibacillus sp. LHD-38]
MINVKDRFYDSSKEISFLNHLDDRDDTFWQALNYLAILNEEKFKEEDLYFHHARYFIISRLINHIIASYQMLKMGLEDESSIMLRQAFELSWLLKYFINNPMKVKKWVVKKKLRITPLERRLSTDNNSTSGKIYDDLSNIVHSNSNSIWGSCIGGMHNSWITDRLFGLLMTIINDVIEYFEEIVSLFDISISNSELIHMKEAVINRIGYSIYETSYLLDSESTVNKLKELGEDDVIRYLEESYEIVE